MARQKSRAVGGSGGRRDCAEAGMAGDFWDCESPFRGDGDMSIHAAGTFPVDPASFFF